MGKRAVRLRHPVSILFLFYRGALVLGSGDQFVRKPPRDRLPLPGTRRADDPAHRKDKLAIRVNLMRDLIIRTAHPLRNNLEKRRSVLYRLFEYLDRILFRFFGYRLKRRIHRALRSGLFSVPHHVIDKAAKIHTAELYVGFVKLFVYSFLTHVKYQVSGIKCQEGSPSLDT